MPSGKADGSQERNNEGVSDDGVHDTTPSTTQQEVASSSNAPASNQQTESREQTTAGQNKREREGEGDSETDASRPTSKKQKRLGSEHPEKEKDLKAAEKGRKNKKSKAGAHKHAPITKKGTKFLWEQNQHVSDKPIKTGTAQPKACKLNLKATVGGKKFTFKYPGRKNMDWNDKQSISNLNKWRRQVIRRKLNKPGDKATRAHRQPWTQIQKNSLKHLIEASVRKTGYAPTSRDWRKMLKKHNAKFEGTKMEAGEKTPGAMKDGKLSQPGQVKKDLTISARTQFAIRAQAGRWPDVQQMIDGILEEVEKRRKDRKAAKKAEKQQWKDADTGSAAQETDDSSSDDTSSESDWSETDTDAELEDPSDDEHEGQRPAANPTGGVLIPA